MQIDDLSPVEKGDAIACGDDGEQLIANVLLAVMVSQLFSMTAAKAHIDRAYALARMLAQQSVTYRPSRHSLACRLSRTPRHVASTDLEMAYTVKAAHVFHFRTAEVTCARILFSDRVIVAERFHRGSGYFSAGQALFRSRRRGGALWAADIRVRPVF